MKDLVLTVDGTRFRVKGLDNDFAAYVERNLEEAGIHFNRDNPADKLFNAYLHLAARSYDYEKEIEQIIEE
ncbi:hypothetical protein [Nitratifractor sp.]